MTSFSGSIGIDISELYSRGSDPIRQQTDPTILPQKTPTHHLQGPGKDVSVWWDIIIINITDHG